MNPTIAGICWVSFLYPTYELSLYDRFYLRDRSLTIEDLIKLTITKLSENIVVKRFQRFAVEDNSPPNPSGGVPANPLPNAPTPLADEVELDF